MATLANERRQQGRIMYLEAFETRMAKAPANINRFCDLTLSEDERAKLIQWNRNVDDQTSPLRLQIVFAFSIPTEKALAAIKAVGLPIVSMGCGLGYWEYLLRERGVVLDAFDIDDSELIQQMAYLNILKGEPPILANYAQSALFISWPDGDESSTLSDDCLKYYTGPVIIHVGELFGETLSSNPFGMSTNMSFQLALLQQFRLVHREQLPNWPGHRDSLTFWYRISPACDCGDGALFHYFPKLAPL